MAGADKAIGAAMLAAGVAIGSGVAWVARGFYDRKEKQKLKDDIEAANREIESILATFEMESARMERIIADISLRNPSTAAEMAALLREHGLNAVQSEVIINSRFKTGQNRGAQ
jgi:hypothetical protein